jgi:hypothetical protein
MALQSSAVDSLTGLPVDAAQSLFVREQWESNWGYCGETSLIAIGMSFGQYASQFTVRELASPGIAQDQESSQLLLGVNGEAAARAMHLTASEYNGSTAKPGSAQGQRFFSWIRDRMNTGVRVMLGVYIKGSQDREYDHIVPAIEVVAGGLKDGGKHVLQDRLFFADNYGQIQSGMFRDLWRNRRQANVSSAPPYSIPSSVGNYALAIRGVADPDRVTIPVVLQASRNSEPVLLDGSLQPPTPEPLAIRATVLIPDQNQSYNVYRYDDFREVPETSFNGAAESAVQSWLIPAHSGGSVSFDIDVLTSDTVVFRAVPTTAL